MALRLIEQLERLLDALAQEKIEGLTKMKLMAGRHQDLADLENLGIAFDDED